MNSFGYVDVKSLDLTGLEIAEEYRAAINKANAGQQLLRAKTEIEIAEQEALRYETLNRSLDDQVCSNYFLINGMEVPKLFLAYQVQEEESSSHSWW